MPKRCGAHFDAISDVKQVGGAKLTDAKDIDRLQESLEKIVGTSSRSLQRTASKRPLVGDVSQTGNKSLLYNLMGRPPLFTLLCQRILYHGPRLQSPIAEYHGSLP